MKEIYIYHHLGLGDYIILNGLVRHVAESYDRVWIFAKPGNNSKNVKHMYRDNHNIHILALDDAGARGHMKMFTRNNYMLIGHTSQFFKDIDDKSNNKTFDELFYDQHNIPFDYKWKKFHLQRDLKREKEVYYDILGLNDDSKFLFVHESTERPINRELPKDTPIIRPDNMEVGLFDYLYTIEKAKEVHVMNSSFMNLIDCIQLRMDNLFYHEYSRPNINTILRLPWNIIK